MGGHMRGAYGRRYERTTDMNPTDNEHCTEMRLDHSQWRRARGGTTVFSQDPLR